MTSRLLSPLFLVGLALAAAPGAHAWGPYAHAVFNERALAALRDHPETSFLARGPCPAIFVAASSVCDLTFNVLALGKTHQEYDDLLHRQEFLDHLLDTAEWRNDLAALTFALAMRTHLVADRHAGRPEGLLGRPTFGWTAASFGGGGGLALPPVGAVAARHDVTVNLNKLLIDSMMYLRRRTECSYAPFVDTGLLVEAISTYAGPGAVPRFTDAEKEEIRTKVESLALKFTVSYQVLESTVRKLAENATLQAGLRRHFALEDEARLDDPDGCVPLIVADIREVLVRKTLAPVSSDPAADGPWCGTERALGGLQAFGQGLLSMAWTLPQSYAEAATGASEVEDLERRIYLTFFSAIAEPGIAWETLQGRLHDLVPGSDPLR